MATVTKNLYVVVEIFSNQFNVFLPLCSVHYHTLRKGSKN